MVDATDDRRMLALAGRDRRRHGLPGGLQHRRRDGHDPARRPVVHRELGQGPALGHVRVQRRRPRRRAGRRRGLCDVANNGERPRRASAHQRPPGHGRELLGLVDHDVPVSPRPVGCGAFRDGQHRPDIRKPSGQLLCGHHASRRRRRQDAARIPHILGALRGRRGGHPARRLGVFTQQLGELVEQRDVVDRPRCVS